MIYILVMKHYLLKGKKNLKKQLTSNYLYGILMLKLKINVRRNSMENKLRLSENKEFGKIRVELVDNEPYFNLNDICKILDIGNSSDVKKRLEGFIILISKWESQDNGEVVWHKVTQKEQQKKI